MENNEPNICQGCGREVEKELGVSFTLGIKVAQGNNYIPDLTRAKLLNDGNVELAAFQTVSPSEWSELVADKMAKFAVIEEPEAAATRARTEAAAKKAAAEAEIQALQEVTAE